MFHPAIFAILEGDPITDAVAALTTLGLLPYIAAAAVVGLAVLIFKRTRK